MSKSFLRVALAAGALVLAFVLAPVARATAPDNGNGNSASAPGQQKPTQAQAQGQGNGSSSDAPGQQRPAQSQPGTQQGKSDGNGANQSGPYDPSGVGEPSGNGRSESNNGKRPCAGCVGNADAKNPPGQLPGGSDANRGYECDENQGVGKTNPAHSGCREKAAPPPPRPPHHPSPPREVPKGGPPALVPVARVREQAGAVRGLRQEQPSENVGLVQRRGGPEAAPKQERRNAHPLRAIGQLPFTGGALLIVAAIGILALAGGAGVQRLVRGRMAS